MSPSPAPPKYAADARVLADPWLMEDWVPGTVRVRESYPRSIWTTATCWVYRIELDSGDYVEGVREQQLKPLDAVSRLGNLAT